MRIAVTGGSGQLGSLVLERLDADPRVERIVSLDLRPPRVPSRKLTAIRADVRDPDLARHLDGIDALVHLAFVVVAYAPRPEMDAINVGGSRNVFEAAARAGVRQIVYSSSVAAYGVVEGHPVPLTEDAPRVYQPEFPYARTKYEVEAVLDEFERAHPDIAVARLRPTILVGRYMEHALGTLLRHRRLPNLGDGPSPLVWDEDVADAVALCLDQRARGAFNLSADELLPSRELARRTGLTVAAAPRWLIVGAIKLEQAAHKLGLTSSRPGDPAWITEPRGTLVPSSERAREVLGWRRRCDTAVSVIERYLATVPTRPHPAIALWLRVLDTEGRAGVQAAAGDAIVHLRVDGPRGGDWALEVAGGRVRVHAGRPSTPTSMVALDAPLLARLLGGDEEVGEAHASGTIRLGGDGAGLAIVDALVRRFVRDGRGMGPRAWSSRALAAWMARAG